MQRQNPLTSKTMSKSARIRFVPARLSFVLLWTLGGLCFCEVGAAGEPPSWVFRRSQFSHDPLTGARVAQYSRTPPVEPLPDPRLVTSGYRRTRTNLRGGDGSLDSYYNVSSYGNGLGGLDAEWERFHDAWLQSFTAGGYYYDQRRPVHPHHAFPHHGYPHRPDPHHGYPQQGYPQQGYPPQGPSPAPVSYGPGF